MLERADSMKKTNVARILDQLGIVYEMKEYPVDISDLGAIHAAAQLEMPVQQVFKTLVARGDKTGIIMACIPGSKELDMKSLAVVSHNKKVEMVHMKEIQGLTGYIRGGCSPLGGKKEYPVYLDISADKQEKIAVSAGKRGTQIVLAPKDLMQAAHAVLADITKL